MSSRLSLIFTAALERGSASTADLKAGDGRHFRELVEGSSKLPEVAWPRTEFWPRVNVSETDKEMMITAELPGVDQKDIEVTVTGDQLQIKGEKKSEIEEKKDEKGRAFHRVERSFRSFQRLMSLPYEIDPDKVQASFKDGVLT